MLFYLQINIFVIKLIEGKKAVSTQVIFTDKVTILQLLKFSD